MGGKALGGSGPLSAGDLSDLGSPALPQKRGESSSHPQEHSLVYCVWLNTPTQTALFQHALFISVCLLASPW